MKNKKPILIIDGKYYLYRSVTSNIRLSHNDMMTTVYYNYLNALKSLANKFNPKNIIIAWDSDYSYRKELFEGYKVKDNSKTDKLVVEQLLMAKYEYPIVKDILKKLGIASYNKFGLEADDLMCYITKQFSDETFIICTSDGDIYQLLEGKRVSIYDPKVQKIKTEKWLMKEFQVTPEEWILYKAINGCESDKVPGIPTIGKKSTMDYIHKKAKPKAAQKIVDNWGTVQRNLLLVKLPFKELKTPLKMRYTDINIEYLLDLCQKFGFKSFMKDLKSWSALKRS